MRKRQRSNRRRSNRRRFRALFGVLSLSAGLLAVNPLVAGPAQAWSSSDQPPTAENWEALRRCESDNDYAADTGNGYYGAYQFSVETWRWLGFGGWPNEASPQVQDHAAMHLYDYSNWDSWPSCSRQLGLKYTSS